MATTEQINTITEHYLIALLWTMPGDDDCENPGDDIDFSDIPADTIEQAKHDVTDFVKVCGPLFDQAMECYNDGYGRHPDADSVEAAFGHDFALTRNGHGCGFWDREHEGLPKFIGDALTRVCQKKFNECDLYIGDDGKVYF